MKQILYILYLFFFCGYAAAQSITFNSYGPPIGGCDSLVFETYLEVHDKYEMVPQGKVWHIKTMEHKTIYENTPKQAPTCHGKAGFLGSTGVWYYIKEKNGLLKETAVLYKCQSHQCCNFDCAGRDLKKFPLFLYEGNYVRTPCDEWFLKIDQYKLIDKCSLEKQRIQAQQQAKQKKKRMQDSIQHSEIIADNQKKQEVIIQQQKQQVEQQKQQVQKQQQDLEKVNQWMQNEQKNIDLQKQAYEKAAEALAPMVGAMLDIVDELATGYSKNKEARLRAKALRKLQRSVEKMNKLKPKS